MWTGAGSIERLGAGEADQEVDERAEDGQEQDHHDEAGGGSGGVAFLLQDIDDAPDDCGDIENLKEEAEDHGGLGGLRLTVTVKVQVCVPQPLVTVAVTVVVPIGKTVPLSFE